jgi:protein-disulfide isomerase
VGATAIVLLHMFVPRYWKTPGWADLPRLDSGTDESGHHWIGARDPKLTIVEFSDYQCPHCRSAHKDMRILAAKHPNQIRLVHRHLPLDMACNPDMIRPFHVHACRLAEAAECAGLQGHFWDMNDAIFSTQERVKADNVDPAELAVRLGLNRSEFKRCLESHTTRVRVAQDVQEATARKLDGTPTFLIGEQLFLGRIPEAALQRWLDSPGKSR